MKTFGVFCLLALMACSANEGNSFFGQNWFYSKTRDKISNAAISVAYLPLNHSEFTDQADALFATCSPDGFEFFLSSEGYWGSDSRYFRKNQRFELRIDDKVFKGKYLPDVDGNAAWLLSNKPTFSAINRDQLLSALVGATSIAVRVRDYRGSTNTSAAQLSGNSLNLMKVLQDCGLAMTSKSNS